MVPPSLSFGKVARVALSLLNPSRYANDVWRCASIGGGALYAVAPDASLFAPCDDDGPVRAVHRDALKACAKLGTSKGAPAFPIEGTYPEPLAAGVSLASWTMETATLLGMLDSVTPAMARELTRYAISGVLWSHFEGDTQLCATDGRRVHVVGDRMPFDHGKEATTGIVPRPALLAAFLRMIGTKGSVRLSIDAKTFRAEGAGAVLVLLLLDRRFPDYWSVMPKRSKYHVGADTGALAKAVADVLPFAGNGDALRLLSFSVLNGSAIVAAECDAVGKLSRTVPTTGHANVPAMMFCPQHFLEAVEACTSPRVAIDLSDDGVPIAFSDERMRYRCALMPIRGD